MADLAHTTETFRASDGYSFRWRKYPASGAPKAEVVLLHGIQSHAGWYEDSCTHLSRCGYTVSFLDRRGSGANDEARGDAPSFRRLVEDVAEFLTAIPRAVSRDNAVVRVPVYLGGISWGGKLVVALERRHPALADGVMLLCPGFFPKIYPSLRQRLRIALARFFRPRKTFPIPLNDPELFTQNPERIEFLRRDPLRLHQATARLLVESAWLDRYLRSAPRYVHVPTLLLLAEHDRILRNDRTREYVERFAAADKTIREFAGAHHTLEFEPNPAEFLGELVGWLDRQTAQHASAAP